MRITLDLRSRFLVAVVAASLALSGTGLACLLACAVEAAHEHGQAAPDHDAGDVLCGSDPAPAILAHVDGAPTLSVLGIILPAAMPVTAAPVVAYARAAIKLPDRSPPVPPGFVVLRI